MRTMSLENVRFERNEMREAMNEAKFKRRKILFLYFSKDAELMADFAALKFTFTNTNLIKHEKIVPNHARCVTVAG